MRPSRASAVLCGLALVAGAGCSREESDGTPVSCREGEEAVLEALRAAPGAVTLDGTPLSECLDDTTEGGELADVGTAYLAAASRLADRAQARPEGRAALQLGYLLGAVRRSEAGTQGVGYELGRRLRSEAARVPGESKALARGERAGARRG